MNQSVKCIWMDKKLPNIKKIIMILVIIAFSNCQFPIGFTIVRNPQPSLDFDQFLSAIGRPEYDPNSKMQIGYNMISLAGFSESSTYSGLDSNLSPIMQWKKIYQTILGNKVHPLGTNSKQIQKHIIDNIFHTNGSSLLMHVQLVNSPISGSAPVSANSLAQEIVTTATQLQLDGISIQFADYNAVKQNTASDWLESLLRNIRANTQNAQLTIVLVIPPTYVNNMKLFRSISMNSFVDFFVLKYYGTTKPDFTSYQNLFQKSAYYPQTAMFQLLKKQDVYIDICRTLIAKPVDSRTSWNSMQFISQTDLDSSFMQAFSKLGWFGGFANLYFETDKTGAFVNAALKSLRNECTKTQNCIC